ncbi:MAG: glycosyltransferase [Paracoccus sp. (in: a-proteobacteria)]
MFDFSLIANLSDQAPSAPDELVDEAIELSRSVNTVSDATAALERILPRARGHAPHEELSVATATLFEKQRQCNSMLGMWEALHFRFPQNLTALRMTVRWYRRIGAHDDGGTLLHRAVPGPDYSAEDLEILMMGYEELKRYGEIDLLMQNDLQPYPNLNRLLVRYIKILIRQHRLADASQVAELISDPQSLGPEAKRTLSDLKDTLRIAGKRGAMDPKDVLGRIAGLYLDRQPPACEPDRLGPVLFLTGQLGAGGAERQITRLVRAFHSLWASGDRRIGRHEMVAAPAICIRHANSQTNADFFLPLLTQAGVDTTILTERRLPAIEEALVGAPQEVIDLIELLPEDLRQNTLKLVVFLRERAFDKVYLWQDGGVLMAAVAALIAGVPRIVTSFRGLPPSLRPEFMRAEIPSLFKTLVDVPGVQYSANSRNSARAYEQWLGLGEGRVSVIHNAVPPLSPEGGDAENAIWSDILSRSPDCTQTVIGIFRFDPNKRPDLWVEVAMAQAKADPKVRFLILGKGDRYHDALDAVRRHGMKDRVFLPGATTNVGFYLGHADLIMHLARFEGLPNVLIEAAQLGVPALATPAGGTSEIVIDGESGVLLRSAENPDPDEIRSSLKLMLSDPERLTAMGSAARANALQQFSLGLVMEQTVELLCGGATAKKAKLPRKRRPSMTRAMADKPPAAGSRRPVASKGRKQ